MGGMTVTLRN